MLRGIHKNMICVQPPQSRYFETVWFVLRPEYRKDTVRDRDMIREAGRILADSEKNISSPRGKSLNWEGRARLLFFAGSGCGVALTSLLWLFIALLR
ncbi:MAG: hypothetical protein IJY47_05670 [Clostridia bacterium]|nr:hypothetical protein [Clostridia bacterium]